MLKLTIMTVAVIVFTVVLLIVVGPFDALMACRGRKTKTI